jgi:nitroreductase
MKRVWSSPPEWKAVDMSLAANLKLQQDTTLRRFLGRWFRAARSFLQAVGLVVSTASLRSSGFYYFIINRSFDREHIGVAAGKARFARDLAESSRSSYRLRRNIHRLEKGIIMPNRRAIFARDYIRQTIEDFERMVSSYAGESTAGPELTWAHDVLSEYFRVVDRSEERIKACYEKFLLLSDSFENCGRRVASRSAPFIRDLSNGPSIDVAQLAALSVRRRSVRSYADKPVPRELVDKAMEVAGQAPSACNRQPFRFRLYDDRNLVKQILALPAGTKGFSGGVPCVAVIVGRLRAYPLERDRHIIYIDGSLAAMSFMFALETMGLSSCAINWADEDPAETRMKKLLKLEDDERVIMLIAYGWPDASAAVPFSAKRDLDELREYNVL